MWCGNEENHIKKTFAGHKTSQNASIETIFSNMMKKGLKKTRKQKNQEFVNICNLGSSLTLLNHTAYPDELFWKNPTSCFSNSLREPPWWNFFPKNVFSAFYGQKHFFVKVQMAAKALQMIRMLWKSMEAIFGPYGTCHLKMTFVALFCGRIFCVKLWQALCNHHLTGFGWKWQNGFCVSWAIQQWSWMLETLTFQILFKMAASFGLSILAIPESWLKPDCPFFFQDWTIRF